MEKLFFTMALLTSLFATGQSDERFVRKGLLRASGGIVSGNHFSGLSCVYLNGNAEYHPDASFSVRGDMNVLAGSRAAGNGHSLEHNHSVLLGMVMHARTKNKLDPYLVLQPGMAITSVKFSDEEGTSRTSALQVTPLATAGIGFNYYFPRFAHLFAEARYVYGNHLSDLGPVSLEEMRFSFGLGFNVFTIKKRPA
jgi:hypothetical protein